MNQETMILTQCNHIKEKVSHYAISEKGKQRIIQLKPSSNIAVVKKRLQETSEAKALLLANLHMPFMGLTGIEHLTNQIEKGFVLEPTELLQYADFLRSSRLIQAFMKKNQFLAPLLFKYSEQLTLLPEIEDRIYQVIRGNQILNDASRTLRKLRKAIDVSEKEINQKLHAFLQNKQNKSKLQEAIIVQKNDRYTVPIKSSFKHQLSGIIVETSVKGTTVFIEPSGVKKLTDKLLLLKAEETAEIYQILSELTGEIAERMQEIQSNLEVIAEYDMIFAKAKYSKEIDGVEPELNKEGFIHFVDVYHPLLNKSAVPLSLTLGKNYRGLTITGPNAGGKTVVLKTVGLVTLQTMLGIHIRAKEGTNIALFDQIFVDIGDHQSIENSLSTFSAHMKNISSIYQQTKKNSLILLDEIGSGTEPNEGAALAIAIMEAFYQKGSILLTTTHYGEIKRFSQEYLDFTTAAMAFDTETLRPKFQLLLGETGESNAFWIAEKMNLDRTVIQQAQHYLATREYVVDKKNFKSRETIKEEPVELIDFDQGDRVILTGKNKIGLIYEPVFGTPMMKVYVDKEMVTVHRKQLKLQGKAQDLYPNDYDLASLFEEFHVRKKRRDLERGSKKAYKQLKKNHL